LQLILESVSENPRNLKYTVKAVKWRALSKTLYSKKKQNMAKLRYKNIIIEQTGNH